MGWLWSGRNSRAACRYGLLLALYACGDVSPQPSAAAIARSEKPLLAMAGWSAAPLIPAFSAPVLATLDDRVVLLAEAQTRDWLSSEVGSLDMWEWDGGAWAPRSAANMPSSRSLPGLARLRDKLVMFGGYADSERRNTVTRGFLNETWEWDGDDWKQVYPLTSPAGRHQVPLVSWQDKVLMFGGQTRGGAFGDTWTWDARDWIEQKPRNAPEYCNSPAAAIGGKVVMFCSARDADDPHGHTWEWDGTDWRERTPATRPSNRYSHTLASVDDRVVMFGGYADSGNWQETWVWDGDDWTDVSVQPSPPPRDGYQAAQLDRNLVLYGGGTNETWAWDGASWRIVAPQSMPPARSGYALGAVGDKVILFGGCCRSVAGNVRQYWDDTWQWDGERWTLLHPAQSPPGRAGTVLAAIDATAALLFGGVGASGVLADTWQWDAEQGTWVERTFAERPAARQRHAMAALDGKVILFGGASTPAASSADALGDTWEWSGDTWRRLLVDAPAETVPAAGIDLALGQFGSTLILFTGDQTRTWFWDGHVWSQLSTETWGLPPLGAPRYVATLETEEGPLFVAAGRAFWGAVLASVWNGNTWDAFPMPTAGTTNAVATPIAGVAGTLVNLSGSPSRTWVYSGR